MSPGFCYHVDFFVSTLQHFECWKFIIDSHITYGIYSAISISGTLGVSKCPIILTKPNFLCQPLSVILPPIFQTSPTFEPIWFSQCFSDKSGFHCIPYSFKLLKCFTCRFMLAVLPTFICVFSSLCQVMDQLLHYLLSRQEWPRTIPSTILTRVHTSSTSRQNSTSHLGFFTR